MPYEAYKLYEEYEKDKYKTSTQKKAEGVLKEVEEMKGKETREFESEIDVEKITSELERLLREGADKNGVARGLAGVGTQESMEMRERLLREGADKDYVALGLAGVGTQESMEMRERLLREGANKNGVAYGLAGVGTQESMEMRERLLREGADKNDVAYGLAGVGTQEAMEMRERLLTDPTIQARSFSAGSLVIEGVVCRYGYEQ